LLLLQGFEEKSLLMQGSCCKLATRAADAALMGYLAIKAWEIKLSPVDLLLFLDMANL
jgi:hypothetical protein